MAVKNRFLAGMASTVKLFPRLSDYPKPERDPIPPVERAGRKFHIRSDKIMQEIRTIIDENKKS